MSGRVRGGGRRRDLDMARLKRIGAWIFFTAMILAIAAWIIWGTD